MIKFILPFLMISSHAWASNCDLIKDSDQRNYCRAVESKQIQTCDLIRFSNTKYYCKAVVTGKISYCEFIQGSNDYKQMCKSVASK